MWVQYKLVNIETRQNILFLQILISTDYLTNPFLFHAFHCFQVLRYFTASIRNAVSQMFN